MSLRKTSQSTWTPMVSPSTVFSSMDAMAKDTTAEALCEQVRALRRLDLSARAAMTFELSDNLRQIVADGVRHCHPDWNEVQVKAAVLRIVLGDRLFDEAFGEKGPAAGE